jgi:hypothetical protein
MFFKRKIKKLNYVNGTVKRTPGKKVRMDTMLKLYKVMSVPSLLYGSKT